MNVAPPRRLGLAGSFGRYLPIVADAVHSGSARTRANDENTDYYPVPLDQETLRPGVVYADPYGHVLMLAKRVPQTEGAAGVFLAVDGQPDGTVARKRFWRGNFLYAQNPALGSPGFKRFRPIVESNGSLRRLTNAEIAKNPDYGDFSLDHSRLGVEEFYDRMDDVMSPDPLEPVSALKEAIASLEEQVKTRVTSVENGRKFLNSGKGEADMPDGWAIFEAAGAWEDFSTPSRDLRLLIAIDVVRGFPDRVARRPERYAMPADKSVGGGEGRIGARACRRACGPQILLYAQRRLAMDACAERRDRTRRRSRNGLQPQRLRRTALGRGPKAARRRRPASAMRRGDSARRCSNTAPGSMSAAARLRGA